MPSGTTAMTGSTPSAPWRLYARHLLAITALLSTLAAFLTTFSLLAAGTLQLDSGRLLFSPLAPVHFHGIIPNQKDIYIHSLTEADFFSPGQQQQQQQRQQLFQFQGDDSTNSTITWQVEISLFLNAFGFEWPQAPKWQNQCGIMRNVHGAWPSSPAARLPADLAIAGRYMGLDEEEYGCLDSGPQYGCRNPFLALWFREMMRATIEEGSGSALGLGQREFSMTVPSVTFYLVLCMLIGKAVLEGLMRWMPKAFRCSCPGFMKRRKGWCVCWIEEEDGQTLSTRVRDRIRVRNFRILEGIYLFAMVWTLVQAWLFKRFVDGLDHSFGGGMQATIGTAFVGVSSAGLLALAFADVCLVVRGHFADREERGIALLNNGAPGKNDDEDEDEDEVVDEPHEEPDARTAPKVRSDDDPLISV